MKIQSINISFDYKGERLQYSFQDPSVMVNPLFEMNLVSSSFPQGQKIALTLVPQQELRLHSVELAMKYAFEKGDRVFLNGFQTWTESREYGMAETILPLNRWTSPVNRVFEFKNYGDYHFYETSGKPGYFHSFTWSTLSRGRSLKLIGSLNETNGYSIIEYAVPEQKISLRKDCEGLDCSVQTTILEFLICDGREQDLFDTWFQHLSLPAPHVTQSTGWTSWYNYYTKITPEILLDNLNAFASRQIPLDLFQIDDGYQEAVGDWLQTNSKFPEGLTPLTGQIHANGYKAGLWLAPFVCEKNSRLFHDKPEWLLKNEKGHPLTAGFCHLWSGDFYALDVYHPEFRQYLIDVFAKVFTEWNFDMVKLDFLYAVALQPRLGKSRGQIMYEAMKFLREIIGDKIILGCGVPLGSAFGLVDFCRISCDIALKWEDALLNNVVHYRERVSTRSALTSTIFRRQLNHRAFVNDPDVFLLRDNNLSLTVDQRKTLFIMNLVFGGLLFTSDHIGEYSKETLDLYQSQFPLRNRDDLKVEDKDGVYYIRFRSDDREYWVFSNFTPKSRGVSLRPGAFYCDEEIVFKRIKLEPFETKCLHRLSSAPFDVAGSTSHIFPGMDVERVVWNMDNTELVVSQKCPRYKEILLRIPKHFKGLTVNDHYFKSRKMNGENLLRVCFHPSGELVPPKSSEVS
ncbi:MAG: alpha-galactosidase [SAR324 cluster bacterium]|nr:alpha-galactosidase [SAR324 cluster bacterium]